VLFRLCFNGWRKSACSKVLNQIVCKIGAVLGLREVSRLVRGLLGLVFWLYGLMLFMLESRVMWRSGLRTLIGKDRVTEC